MFSWAGILSLYHCIFNSRSSTCYIITVCFPDKDQQQSRYFWTLCFLTSYPVLFLSLTYCFLRQPTSWGMQQKCFKHTSYLSHRIIKRYLLQSWDLIKLIFLVLSKGILKWTRLFLFCFELHVVVTVRRVPSYCLGSSQGTGSVTHSCFSVISADVTVMEKINNILVLLLR